MTAKEKYQPSPKAQAFLDSVENGKYKRQIITGITKILKGKVEGGIESLYSKSELQALAALQGTPMDVEARMPVKITQHYYELAKDSLPLQTLVKASPKETGDLEGSADPGKQMDYSPVEGLIHKYELGLIYVALTCSAHCRFWGGYGLLRPQTTETIERCLHEVDRIVGPERLREDVLHASKLEHLSDATTGDDARARRRRDEAHEARPEPTLDHVGNRSVVERDLDKVLLAVLDRLLDRALAPKPCSSRAACASSQRIVSGKIGRSPSAVMAHR